MVSPADAETGQGPLWLGRLISVLGVAILFGSLVTIAAAWPEGVEYLVAVKFIRTIWIVAVIGTVLYVASATAAATGGTLGQRPQPGELDGPLRCRRARHRRHRPLDPHASARDGSRSDPTG